MAFTNRCGFYGCAAATYVRIIVGPLLLAHQSPPPSSSALRGLCFWGFLAPELLLKASQMSRMPYVCHEQWRW